MTLDQPFQIETAHPISNVPAPAQPPRAGILIRCEPLPYERAWNLQRACRTERAADRCEDLLLLLEHPPVFTVGRTTQDQHWPGESRLTQESGIPVIRTERGGSITYHGPGQLIGYPVLRLYDFCAGPKAYVHRLEDVIISTLAEWGIAGHRRERLPGVWVGGNVPSKIASIGVRISQGVTTHGFALNVCLDLAPFSYIVPCGIADCRVTSMTALLGEAPEMSAVQERLAHNFAQRFHLEWTEHIGPDRFMALTEPSPATTHEPLPPHATHQQGVT
jgi:lipoyl(octanoyl) transferase